MKICVKKIKSIDLFIILLIGLIALCFIDIGIKEKYSRTEECVVTHLTSSNVSTDFGYQSVYKASVKGETIAHVFVVSDKFYASYKEGDTVHVKIRTMYSISREFTEYILLEDLELTEE